MKEYTTYPSTQRLLLKEIAPYSISNIIAYNNIIENVTTNKYNFDLSRYNLGYYLSDNKNLYVLTDKLKKLYYTYYYVIGNYEAQLNSYIHKNDMKLAKYCMIEIFKLIYYTYSHIMETEYEWCIDTLDQHRHIPMLCKFLLEIQDNIRFILVELLDDDYEDKPDMYDLSIYKFTHYELELIGNTKQLLFACYINNINNLKVLDYLCKKECNPGKDIYILLEKYGNKYLFVEELMQNRFHPKNIYKFNDWGFEGGISDCNDDDDEK